MTRALRVVILIGALFVGYSLLVLVLFSTRTLPPLWTGPGGELTSGIWLFLAMLLAGLVGSAIMSTAGVVAIVTTTQRRQPGWTITLIGVLALFCASVLLIYPFPVVAEFLLKLPLVSTVVSFGGMPLLALALATLTGVLTLIYSFIPVQSASSPTGQTAKE